jgi:hypothetical protein
MLPDCCGGRRYRSRWARCAAVRRGWRSLPGLLSARADLAAVGSGARLPCRHRGLRPVLPRSVVRAAGGALSVVSPYRRSPLPFPGFRGPRRSWGITLFRLLGGYSSLPSGISDSTRQSRRFQRSDSAVPVQPQCGSRPVPGRFPGGTGRAEPSSAGAKSQYHREIAPCYRSPSARQSAEPHAGQAGRRTRAYVASYGHIGRIWQASRRMAKGPVPGVEPTPWVGLARLLAERSEERPPRVSVEGERSSVAVGGVAHQDSAAVAGCLYARPVLAAE